MGHYARNYLVEKILKMHALQTFVKRIAIGECDREAARADVAKKTYTVLGSDGPASAATRAHAFRSFIFEVNRRISTLEPETQCGCVSIARSTHSGFSKVT